MLKRSQILGILFLGISLSLAFLWDKTFKYADFLDFILGVFCALALSVIFKLLPIFRKLDK